MEKSIDLSKLKKEFFEEINGTDVGLECLKGFKIPKGVLENEVALRKVFGDEIYQKKKTSDEVDGVKEIIKLSDEDIAFDAEVQKLTEELTDVNFETGVNIILSKVSEQEDE